MYIVFFKLKDKDKAVPYLGYRNVVLELRGTIYTNTITDIKGSAYYLWLWLENRAISLCYSSHNAIYMANKSVAKFYAMSPR